MGADSCLSCFHLEQLAALYNAAVQLTGDDAETANTTGHNWHTRTRVSANNYQWENDTKQIEFLTHSNTLHNSVANPSKTPSLAIQTHSKTIEQRPYASLLFDVIEVTVRERSHHHGSAVQLSWERTLVYSAGDRMHPSARRHSPLDTSSNLRWH